MSAWPQEEQDAYGALLDHLSSCPDCPDVTGCATAQELRRVYKALRAGRPVRVCRACDGVIENGDGVVVFHETGSSGPGWDVWAHRAHADQVEIIDDDLLRIMLRLWAAGS